MIRVTDTVSIREDEIEINFVQASGPGGQNVNKVASKAQLRFNTHSASLPEEVGARLRRIAMNQITEDGTLVIKAKRYRTQEQNRADAINRLVDMIRRATIKPKIRRPTHPTLASQEKRLGQKRRRSEIKRYRRQQSQDEY
jgi:ribosome-associated protein